MNYGYFDKKNKEYVITRPDTPSPWANYLGDPNYGAIISNNAAVLTVTLSAVKLPTVWNVLQCLFKIKPTYMTLTGLAM